MGEVFRQTGFCFVLREKFLIHFGKDFRPVARGGDL
jgi:hypothetical protein